MDLAPKLGSLVRRWDAEANASARVALGRTGTSAVAAAARADLGREHVRQLRALLDQLED